MPQDIGQAAADRTFSAALLATTALRPDGRSSTRRDRGRCISGHGRDAAPGRIARYPAPHARPPRSALHGLAWWQTGHDAPRAPAPGLRSAGPGRAAPAPASAPEDTRRRPRSLARVPTGRGIAVGYPPFPGTSLVPSNRLHPPREPCPERRGALRPGRAARRWLAPSSWDRPGDGSGPLTPPGSRWPPGGKPSARRPFRRPGAGG